MAVTRLPGDSLNMKLTSYLLVTAAVGITTVALSVLASTRAQSATPVAGQNDQEIVIGDSAYASKAAFIASGGRCATRIPSMAALTIPPA